MSDVIVWCGFGGAWLLFVGPVYQASLELADDEFQRGELETALRSAPQPDPVSTWWWLLPPVAYLVERRRRRALRDTVFTTLEHEQLERLVDYLDKASGWLLVGLGGLLIGIDQTWRLREAFEWPVAAFWALAVSMALLSLVYVAVRNRRSHAVLTD